MRLTNWCKIAFASVLTTALSVSCSNLAVDNELRQNIYNWVDTELDKSILDENVSETDDEEIKFFNRTQILSEELSKRFDTLTDDFRDYIIEDLYDRIYG